MNYIQYGGAPTNNGPSPNLWQDCPILQMIVDPGVGYCFFDDFVDLPTGRYTATLATAGTFALDDAVGGVALADCNSATATQGINVQLGGAAGELFKPAADATLWFEARVKIADTATGPELFVGLANIDTTVIGTSAVSTTDHIGWSSVTDDNVILFNGEKGGVGDTQTSTTMVDDTWINLGYKVHTEAGVLVCDQYINNAIQNPRSTYGLTATNIPILEMVPTFVCQSGGTTDPILHIDWVRVAQLRV